MPPPLPIGMPERTRIRTTWRRREYRIEGGYVRPVEGSVTEDYSPYERRRETLALHEDLARLDPADLRAVRQFASFWGLLGLVSHRLVEAHYLQQVGPWEETDEIMLQGQGAENAPFTEVWDRPSREVRTGWWPNMFGAPSEHAEGSANARFAEKRERERLSLLADLPPGKVTGRTFPGCHYVYPLDEYWRTYFPTGPLVSLSSTRAWDYMAEPLSLWEQEVRRYQDTLKRSTALFRGELTEDEAKQLADDFRTEVEGAFVTVEASGNPPALLAGVSVPSLLAAAYLSALHAIKGGARYGECQSETCGEPFMYRAREKKYCSDDCGKRQYQRRRYRRDKAEAAKGETK